MEKITNEYVLKFDLPCTSDTEKGRYWTFVVYPDSAPADWKSILCRIGLPWACSPLHDKDLQIETSVVEKKPHWHVLLQYGNSTTRSCIINLISSLNCTVPFHVVSPRGLFRYFTHQDNPEKYQYPQGSEECYNGFDPLEMFSKTDISKAMIEVANLIRRMDLDEYSSVEYYLIDNDLLDLLYVFQSHTIHFNALLTSLRHRKQAIVNKYFENPYENNQKTT